MLLFLILTQLTPLLSLMWNILLLMMSLHISLCIILLLISYYIPPISHLFIAYVVYVVNQFLISPTKMHWIIVLCILRYLCGTQLESLLFPSSSSLKLCAYSDVDWIGDLTDHKTITCFCIFLEDSIIYRKNKK